MANKKKTKSRRLSTDDADLWKATTKDVKPLEGKAYEAGSEPVSAPDAEEGVGGRETALPARQEEKPKNRKGTEVDRRTEERFRKGEMEIEARLDLHGYRQDEAQSALNSFITNAYQQGKRCVLVITGTGRTKQENQDWWEEKPGILKRRVPEWLKLAPIRDFVLKTHQAKQKDGGEGALYVLLRRKRDN